MKTFIVKQGFTGLLYEDGVFVKALTPGKYQFDEPFFQFGPETLREVRQVDMRETSLTLKGQEILTADKVAIRVSLLVYFKVTNAELAIHNVEDYRNRIYEDVQLAARRFLASKSLDAILVDRNEISDAVRDDVKESAGRFGVEILRADVKDLVFPGNLRDIMNKVLETERRAAARLIEAQKEAEANIVRAEAEAKAEIAHLKAEKEQILLKTETEKAALEAKLAGEIEVAKALAENPALLKLKQLEVLRELAQVGGGKFVLGLKTNGLTEALE